MNDESIQNQQIETLAKELRDWSKAIRWVAAGLLVVPMYCAVRLMLMVPRFETIYEDMLGSKDKLPELTKLVLKAPLALLATFCGLFGLAACLIFTLRKARHVCMTVMITILLLIAFIQLMASALMDPLARVIQNLSGEAL